MKAKVRNPVYVRQAIITTFHGPTNHRGARITARARAGRITIPFEYGIVDAAHARAACALADQYQWGRTWTHGVLPDGRHVFTTFHGGK